MAMAVVSSAKLHVSKPLPITSHSRRPNPPPEPSSSRYPQPPPSPDVFSSTPSVSEAASRSFQRLFENSFRTATRSKKAPAPPVDEFATIASKAKKGKDRGNPNSDDAPPKSDGKLNVFRKVTFRGRSGRESPPAGGDDGQRPKERVAGRTSYITPSMRQASMSSPALHLSSQALPSPKSQPTVNASSSSNTDVLVSPHRSRSRRATLQPATGGPPPASQSNGVSRHRSTKSVPVAIPPSPSSPSLPIKSQPSSRDPPTPVRTRAAPISPSHSPTPFSASPRTTPPVRISTKPSSSASPRASSPPPARSPSTRLRVATPSRGIASSSTSHLPLSSSPSPTPHRPSVDSPHRHAFESPRRSSGEYPRRTSFDIAPRQSPTPVHGEPSSPIRPRSQTPSQRAYAQNRHFNISAGSLLLPPSNPEHREVIRSATSMLCKEILKPPPHMAKTEAGAKDWEEVELRTRALVRLERVWNKSINSASSPTSPTSASAAGEERERKMFCDALRDGYVLCQLLNKLRASSVVRPDPREDGVSKASNVTKFLAGCASYGLSNDDLFHRDDLSEATSESLARVAHTIIMLIKFVESPVPSRSKYMSGQNNKNKPLPRSPYGTLSKSSNSTPNLHSPTSQSPTPGSRKRWSPPSDLPPLRSQSPENPSVESFQTIRGEEWSRAEDTEDDEDEEFSHPPVPLIKKPPPPPRSPLRKPLSKPNDPSVLSVWSKTAGSPSRASMGGISVQATIGDASVRDSMVPNARQSMASSVLTSTTVLSTAPSSLLDNGHGNFGKYGTIRTVTTDMTSAAPSLSRAEGSSIAEAMAQTAPAIDVPPKRRDRKSSELRGVDLSQVVEESDETVSRAGAKEAKAKGRSVSVDQRPVAVNLRKGKWPDDFFDAFQMPKETRSITPVSSIADPDESLLSTHSTPVVVSAPKSSPRKIAVVGNRSIDDGPQVQFPRRPTHRPRHSVDNPVLLPKDPSLLRDSPSPSPISASPTGRVILRRNSSKPHTPRSASLVPRGDDSRGSEDSLVPFPRAGSNDQTNRIPSPGTESVGAFDRPRLRGRFQSDIESGNARRARIGSNEGSPLRPTRGRIESMVNMGVTSAATSASDLMARNSIEGSSGRALIVKEEGKPPTHFQLGNCIGRGQFGSVYRALNLNTGQMVAVKRIRLEGLKEEEVTQLMREVDLVKSLSHPSIVKYEGMARDEDTLSIVLEYAENGSLGQTLKSFGKLNERLVASYVVKILEGLHYLHTSDVVHCDLKAANILTTKNGNVKLSDFGVSLNLRAMEREIKDVAGTPNWMAPEVIELKGASTKSDIWSLGCTVIELLTGRPPYAEITNSMSVMFRIVEDDMPPLPEDCSELLEDFLKQCLQKDPQHRPTAELLCEHPWLKENWVELKDLRPQDSIPFLRRVSTDIQKADVSRYFNTQMETSESPVSESFVRPEVGRNLPLNRRTSNLSVRPPPGDNDISPREHTFVKTTFSKPMMCRVCLLNVKKSAVLCAQCSLISHAKCASSAPPTCDLRAQLLLYAQYAEKGNPGSLYSNPVDLMDTKFPVALSEVPYVSPSTPSVTGRADTETPPPQSPAHSHAMYSESPPTAFRFMAAFKRSRSNLTPEPVSKSLSSTPVPPEPQPQPQPDTRRPRKPTLLTKRPERPQSLVSDSTGMSSLRSAATAAESFNSGSGGRRGRSESSSGGRAAKASRFSGNLASTAESEAGRSNSQLISEFSTSDAGGAASYPGSNHPHPTPTTLDSLSPDMRRHKRNAKSAGNCVIQ